MNYDTSNIASPVTNNMCIHIALVAMFMAEWITKILDIKGAFLHGEFDEGEKKIYTSVLEGF